MALTFMCFAWISFSFIAPGEWTNLPERGRASAVARLVVGVSIRALLGPLPRSTQGQEPKPQYPFPTTVTATHATSNTGVQQAKAVNKLVKHKQEEEEEGRKHCFACLMCCL